MWFGTSAATPMVVGATALIQGKYPSLTGTGVIKALDQSARKTKLNAESMESYLQKEEEKLLQRVGVRLKSQDRHLKDGNRSGPI